MDEVSIRASIYFGVIIAVAMFAIQKLRTVPPKALEEKPLAEVRGLAMGYAVKAGLLLSLYEGVNYVPLGPRHWYWNLLIYVVAFSWMFPVAAAFVARVGYEFYCVRCQVEEVRRREGKVAP